MIDDTNNPFKYPRVNARTSRALCLDEEDTIYFESTVEMILDIVFKAINKQVEDVMEDPSKFLDAEPSSYMSVDVNMNQDVDRELFDEVCARLQDYGYNIQLIIGDESEADYMNELSELAKEDETVAKAMEELQNTIVEFRVSWNNIFGEEPEL